MVITEQAHEEFKADVLARYPQEACGFIVDGSYIPCPNSAPEPHLTFRVEPLHYVKAAAMGQIQAVLHSHPYDPNKHLVHPPEWPSTPDMQGWLAGGVPWGICATDGTGISRVVWLDEDNPEPLLGREFLHGVNDCYSVIRDWFRLERGITLKNFARGMDWWNNGADLYSQNFELAGFKEVPREEATVGDCALFQVRSPVINHAAVITGPNQILHHMFHRLSGHDTLSKWDRSIVKVVRYFG